MYEEQFGDSELMAAVLTGDVRLSSLFVHLMLFQILNLEQVSLLFSRASHPSLSLPCLSHVLAGAG